MANGKIRLGKQSGGTLGLVFPDGVSNTEVVLPESGELATKDYVDNLKTIASGTATFTATTNNINLTGIGIGVEIGDVIQISGAEDSKNNSEFTVEVITDNDNIIVNQAHANKGTSKNVAGKSGDTGVTVKLLAKWYNAPIGLGQGWVSMLTSRAVNTNYTNTTGRDIAISVTVQSNGADGNRSEFNLYIGGVLVGQSWNFVVASNSGRGALTGVIQPGSVYLTVKGALGSIVEWVELR